jgi:hypothetical protein
MLFQPSALSPQPSALESKLEQSLVAEALPGKGHVSGLGGGKGKRETGSGKRETNTTNTKLQTAAEG